MINLVTVKCIADIMGMSNVIYETLFLHKAENKDDNFLKWLCHFRVNV